MNRVRFGVAGTGEIVREYHLPVMVKNPRLEIVAACNVGEGSLQLAAKRFGISKTFRSLESLANDPHTDAVLVAVPNNLHAPFCVRLLEAGKHVICEKPMARTVAEARTMLEAAEKSGKTLAIAHPWRCDADFRWLHDVIATGRLGRVFKVRCHAILTDGSPPIDTWRFRRDIAGGGALTDVGIHLIDTTSFLFDDKIQPRKVSATIANHFTKAEVEDTATAIFEFDHGLTVTIEAGWHHNFQNSPHGAIEVFGTQGYARTFPTELHAVLDHTSGKYEANLHPPRSHIDLSMFAVQIDAFVESVLTGKAPPCDGAQGLRDVEWLAAAYQSAHSGGPVLLRCQ